MFEKLFNDVTSRAVHGALDGLSKRQQAISVNIANVDTPGYKAVEVSFEDQLRKVIDSKEDSDMELTHSGHLASDQTTVFSPVTTQSPNNTMRNDGNSVDIDREMTNLAETTIAYSTMTRLAAGRLALLRSIVSDGRR